MNRVALIPLALSLVLGCGDDDFSSPCPDGRVPEGDRCVDFDGGLPDGCLADELCNGIDDDCDGTADEGLSATAFFADADGDGAGDAASPCSACDVSVCASTQPEVGAWVEDDNDCDDACDTCFPGAPELCDVLDNDCDALTDEAAANTYYIDVDGDGFGVNAPVCRACDPAECDALPQGNWVAQRGDCDDTCETCFPGTTETCDGLDNDCDGVADNGVLTAFYRDMDGDTHGDASMTCRGCGAADCGAGAWVTANDDCDDTCDTCFPGGTEVCDERDNDCNGVADNGLQNTFYRDVDGDGQGNPSTTRVFCGTTAPSGWSANRNDCADHDARAFAGATQYYSVPIVAPLPPGGAYDFNCSGAEELDFAECGPQRCPNSIIDPRSPSCYVSGVRGCGNARMLWSCSCLGINCSSSINTRDQACR